MIEPEMRKRYDYENIEKLYIEYVGSKVDDSQSLQTLRKEINDRKVLILAPGHTLLEYAEKIESFINQENPVVISVNFIYHEKADKYAFFGNPRRYEKICKSVIDEKIVISSNVNPLSGKEVVVNYNSLIDRGYKFFDNSTMLLLNLLRNISVKDMYVAGFDGLEKGNPNIYYCKDYNISISEKDYGQINSDLREMLRNFAKTLQHKETVQFITPSQYESIFVKE